MNCALILDINHEREMPADKPVLGRALAVYPLLAIKGSRHIQRTYLLADSPEVKAVALQYQTIMLDTSLPLDTSRPLDTPSVEAMLRHGYQRIREDLQGEEGLEMLALLFTHAPAVTAELIDSGVETLRAQPEADSGVSVSRYNHWNPYYALSLTSDGWVAPYVSFRPQTGGDVWYPDWGLALLRPRALESPAGAPAAMPWLGRKTIPLKQWGGAPVLSDWQVPSAEYWLRKHGVSDLSGGLEMQPKPAPAPKERR